MHLVFDTIIAHELDFTIPQSVIDERSEEWVTKVLKNSSREEYIKGLAAFMGIDLIKYTFAKVTHDTKARLFRVELRSAHWASKLPKF
jgi:hypothetical protein